MTLDVWKTRTYLPNNSKGWYSSRQRLEGLTKAFEQAYSSGSLFEATAALLVLTEYHALAGNDLQTLRGGRDTIMLASQQPSERIRVQTSLNVAVQFLSTEHWESPEFVEHDRNGAP